MNKSSLYVAMTKVSENMLQQAVRTNNLTNSSTPGFRATLAGERAMPMYGDGLPTTVFVGAENTGYDFAPGVIQHTGNSLDIAVNGQGWIAVQGEDGLEGYTRRGDLQINNGMLTNGAGQLVLGDGGPINIAAAKEVNIAEDGTVNVVNLNQGTTMVVAGKIKLVNPEVKSLSKREDGLFVKNDGSVAQADLGVKIKSGGFEQSNVSAINEMIEIIDSARSLEMTLKMMDKVEENDKSSARLLQIAGH